MNVALRYAVGDNRARARNPHVAALCGDGLGGVGAQRVVHGGAMAIHTAHDT